MKACMLSIDNNSWMLKEFSYNQGCWDSKHLINNGVLLTYKSIKHMGDERISPKYFNNAFKEKRCIINISIIDSDSKSSTSFHIKFKNLHTFNDDTFYVRGCNIGSNSMSTILDEEFELEMKIYAMDL